MTQTAALSPTPQPTAPARLGEELPVFCEKCGYSLHGLPATRCECCRILHHRCPECGHTQPINTLRPAFQRILGRVRAWGLALIILIKLNCFGWLLIGWCAMGVDWSYGYDYGSSNFRSMLRPVDAEALLAFALFGLGFGLFARMLLLRWRRSYLIGTVLGMLACTAICIGGYLRQWDSLSRLPDFMTPDFLLLLASAFLTIVLGSAVAWPIWTALVRLFLPKRTGDALLEWQRGQSDRAAALARE